MPSSASRPGRRPYPATHHRWQQRLDRFRKSGLAVAHFCEREGISTASFYAWRRRLQADMAPDALVEPRLVPVRLVPRRLAPPSSCSSPPAACCGCPRIPT
jgi:transposase-like protein